MYICMLVTMCDQQHFDQAYLRQQTVCHAWGFRSRCQGSKLIVRLASVYSMAGTCVACLCRDLSRLSVLGPV